MAEITGSNIEIAPLVRFLVSMGKTGDVLVWRGHWVGQLSLDHGRLSAAAVEHEQGFTALEFISFALQGGRFEFFEGPPSQNPNFELGRDPMIELDRLQTTSRDCPIADLVDPATVPRLVGSPTAADDVLMQVRREDIYVLLAVERGHSVREIATQHDLVRTLTSLGRLYELGL